MFYHYEWDAKAFRWTLKIAIVLATILLIGSFSRNLANCIRDNREGGVSLPTATTLTETMTTEETTTQPMTKETTTELTTETTKQPATKVITTQTAATKSETTIAKQTTTQTATTTTQPTTQPTTTQPETTQAVTTTQVTTTQQATTQASYGKLTKRGGVAYGPSGKETYYNLPMRGVIRIMEAYGYSKEDYWVREDGVKMLGKYIMVAADLWEHPRGSIIPTTLGDAIVCDTGTFTTNGSGVSVDVAVTW